MMNRSRPSRAPKNATPSPCATARRSNGSTKKCARDSSEAPPQRPQVHLPRAVEPRQNKTRAEAKVGIAGTAETVITTTTRGIPLVHRGGRNSSTTQGLLPSRTRLMCRGKRDRRRGIGVQTTRHLPDSRSAVREVRMLVVEVVSDLAAGVPEGVNETTLDLHECSSRASPGFTAITSFNVNAKSFP